MRRQRRPTCATLAAALVVACPLIASAQTEPVIVQAESGTLGADFATGSDGDVTYVTLATQDLTVVTDAPASDAKVITYSVTFPAPGEYELFARIFVETLAQSGQSPPDNDSFFYGNGFGSKMSGAGTGGDWILANGLFGVGTIAGDEVVEGGGGAGDGVWKWIDLSKFNGGEAPITFAVPAGALTQTLQIGGREDGLYIDKLAFGVAGLFYTVNALDNGLPGSEELPPTFTQPGPPIATGQAKFLGNIYSPQQVTDFEKVWNQVTPENAGKWGSVEGTRGMFNWNELDAAFNLAKDNGFPFKQHTLIWGNQQPAWLSSLPPVEQRAAIETWFRAGRTLSQRIRFHRRSQRAAAQSA